MTDLFFCPERWEPDSMISTNAASMIRVHGISGKAADAWQLGDWGSSWTAITSEIPIEAGWLESGEEYRLCFWLNGGENSRGDEICMLEIYGDDWEDRLTFRLNRDHTAPLLEKDHWLLFGVPFRAPKATDALKFRFVAAGAVCTIAGIQDMDMNAAEALTPDERETGQPQRYNIVFPHGYPAQSRQHLLNARGGRSGGRIFAVCAAAAAVTGITAAVLIRRARRHK